MKNNSVIKKDKSVKKDLRQLLVSAISSILQQKDAEKTIKISKTIDKSVKEIVKKFLKNKLKSKAIPKAVIKKSAPTKTTLPTEKKAEDTKSKNTTIKK